MIKYLTIIAFFVVNSLSIANPFSTDSEHALTDQQVSKIILVGLSARIRTAEMSKARAQSMEVQNFADRSITLHKEILADANALFTRSGMTPVESIYSQNLERLALENDAKLARQEEIQFDRTFIEGEVTASEECLNAVNQLLIPVVQNEGLKTLLVQAVPKLEQILEDAKTLLASFSTVSIE